MKKIGLFLIVVCVLMLCACSVKENHPENSVMQSRETETGRKIQLPEKLSTNQEGIPVLSVYQVDEESLEEMDIETYVQGVLAGEMKNDWPMEALKAQAILARTFVLKFCSEKESRYQDADISTDVEEAQAYDSTGINDRIQRAVRETEGMVLSNHGELPYAWFHAHSGGATALAKEGLGYEKNEPDYTQVVKGMDSDQAPAEAANWEAYFSVEEIIAGAKECGLQISTLESIEIGDTGESGRAETIALNGQNVNAAKLRIALGSTKMRSTLLTNLRLENGKVLMRGKGYGHGVGMPQWGAYALAKEGKTAEEIVLYYFRNVVLEKVW